MPELHYCNRCGQCCRVSGAWYAELWQPDSEACKYFQEPDTCTIWETRPLICDTEKMFDLFEKHVPRVRLLNLHKRICQAIEWKRPNSEVIGAIQKRLTRKLVQKFKNVDFSHLYFKDFNPKPGEKNETIINGNQQSRSS